MQAAKTDGSSKTIVTNPAVPLTLEGASVLHQMMRIRWPEWRGLPEGERRDIAREASEVLELWEQPGERQSAVYSLLGHKGDLLFVHFRRSFDELSDAEFGLYSLRLWDYLEPTSSYVSVIELGLYESTAKLYKSLDERGIKFGSEEWVQAVEETLARQRKAMAPRSRIGQLKGGM